MNKEDEAFREKELADPWYEIGDKLRILLKYSFDSGVGVTMVPAKALDELEVAIYNAATFRAKEGLKQDVKSFEKGK